MSKLDTKVDVAVKEKEDLLFRHPNENDGAEIYDLVKDTKVLDVNSPYSYLMWAKYFDRTSVVAEDNGDIVGFISGFILPNETNTFFVWQVAVDEGQRGKGVASRLIQNMLQRPACNDVKFLEATISPSNKASQALFRGISRKLNTECQVFECFSEDQFPEGNHEAEMTYRIGPINKKVEV